MSRLGSPSAILTDIEGTTTPIAFVRDTLFPYARERLTAFLDAEADTPGVRLVTAQTITLAPGRPVLETLLEWMDRDEKAPPLKALQGLIWEHGYASGQLLGRLYPDVPPALRHWHEQGRRLYVYSSGSEAAQRLLFGHSDAGDLSGLFSGFFDTRLGGKRHAPSYRAIAESIGLPSQQILFLSDTEAELDAAGQTGMTVCQVARDADKTVVSARHPVAPDFATVQSRID